MSKFPADFNGFTTSSDRTYYDAPKVNTEDSERQKFESWIMSMPCAEKDDISKNESGEYFHLQTHWCWKSWLARSREAS